MNILKKLLAILAIFGLLGQTTINSFASGQTMLEFHQYEITDNITGGEQIINKIDKLLSDLDRDKIIALNQKVLLMRQNIQIKVSIQKAQGAINTKEMKLLLIIDYIMLKIAEQDNISVTQDIPADFTQTLTEAENKKINDELVKIQKNVLTHGTVYLENIIGEFEKYANYQEKGDFKASVDINHEMLGEIKAELKLNDYEVNNSNFDAQLKTRITAIIDAAPIGEEALKLEISGLLDLISKDQNYYILLQELNIINDSGIEEIEEFIQTMKDIATTNKYIHFEDASSKQVMEILKSFSPQALLAEGNEIVAQPLFKAYKKVGNKYYLIPSKYGCDVAKELAQKFDPFNGSACTQGQYDNLLEDISDSKVEFYIELGSNTTIGFETSNSQSMLEVFNGNISFSDKYIEEINFAIKPNQDEYSNEGAEISYKRNSQLNGYIYANSGEVDITGTSTLDKNNHFTAINLDVKADKFTGDLILKNKNITGKYSLKDSTNNWNGNILGRMDNLNSLSELKITSDLSSTSTYSAFENSSRFEYNKGKIVAENIFSSEGYKSNINVGGSWNPMKNELVAGNLSIDIQTRDSHYDYDTYTRKYNGDFKKVFDTDMTLINKAIKGKTSIIQDGSLLLSIEHSGNYEKNYFNLNNSALINSDFISKVSPIGIYDSQIEKARDSSRIFNMMSLRASIEQSYQDNGEYPTQKNFKEEIAKYMNSMVSDPSKNIEINTCKFGYIYEVGTDNNGVKNQTYRISTCLESSSNKRRIQEDSGSDDLRYELGIGIRDGDYDERFYINDIQTWKKVTTQENKDSDAKLNVNMKIDTRGSTNNQNLYVDLFIGLDRVLELEIDNMSKKVYKDINIVAPNNTIELEEVIDSPLY